MKVLGICALLVLVSTLGLAQTTNGTTASEATTVNLVIPGLVGIDVGSTEVEFDFGAYPAALANDGCVDNEWPLSITCTAGEVHFDPTSVTTTGPVPAPVNTVGGEKAIWLAVFCSKTTGTLTIEANIGAFASAIGSDGGGPLDATIVSTQAASVNNAGAGYATFTKFTAQAADEDIGNTLAATFPWTRVDQSIGLEIPFDAALTETLGNAATLTYTISK
jgi:hypothetical protein